VPAEPDLRNTPILIMTEKTNKDEVIIAVDAEAESDVA
jgi:hypothetical protein